MMKKFLPLALTLTLGLASCSKTDTPVVPQSGITITSGVLSGNKLTGKIPAEYLAYPKTLQLLLPQQAGYGFMNQPK